MGQVRRRLDNVIIDVPTPLEGGMLVIENIDGSDKIYIKTEVNVDDAEDGAEFVSYISVAKRFSLNLDSSDPEGVDPDIEDPILEPTRVPVLRVVEESYKSYITSGVFASQTRINLFVDNNEENFPLEFSSALQGSIAGSSGAEYPVSWVVLSRESNGSYPLVLPSNDDTPPVPQPFYVRFQGNSNIAFGTFITFRTNGDDPLEETPTETPPNIGTANAVIRSDFDLFWTVWGGYAGKDQNRPNDKPFSKTHYAEQSAISGSGRSDYRDQAPFYAFHTEPQLVDMPVAVNVEPWHINEPRFSNIDWQMTANDMKMSIEYLIRSGFQGWNFTYYANTYQLSHMRTLWENLTLSEKRGVKAIYSLHQQGDSGSYKDANGVINTSSEYYINLQHIITMMSEPWYKRIDGKPVLVYFQNETENAINAVNFRAAYNAMYNLTDPFPFYEIQMGDGIDNSFVNQYNMQAKNWYYKYNDNMRSDHSLESSLLDSYNDYVQMGNLNQSRDIAPSLNVALDLRARAEYPERAACIDNVTPGTASYNSGIDWAYYGRSYESKSHSYFNPATSADIASIVSKLASLRAIFGSRMKLAFITSWDENSEGGKSTGMPKLNLDGTTINDEIVEWFRNYYNSGYVNP